MAFHNKHSFDAIKRQTFLDFDDFGLKRTLRRGVEVRETNDVGGNMLWNFARSGCTDIAYGHICGTDTVLLSDATKVILSWARLSLEREEWRATTIPVDPNDFSYRVHGVTERHIEARPVAWLQAHLVLFADYWLTHNALDYDAIAAVLSQDIEGKPAIEGAEDSSELLPLSAWSALQQLPALPDRNGRKRKPMAADRIALMLADDPTQLHDPKSPARKRARQHMRGSMAVWLDNGFSSWAMDWLRTFEWREGQSGLSPREVMLRAYAYMPDVEAPPNIAAEVAQLRKIPI